MKKIYCRSCFHYCWFDKDCSHVSCFRGSPVNIRDNRDKGGKDLNKNNDCWYYYSKYVHLVACLLGLFSFGIGVPAFIIHYSSIKNSVNNLLMKGNDMSLSLGTWVLLIIVMVVVAKVAHKISLKTIFSPTKKAVKHVGKEWEES